MCDKNGNMFPPDNSAILADCLINIVSESDRPASMINCTLAALAHVYKILGKNDFTNDIFIKQLVLGIIKSSTKKNIEINLMSCLLKSSQCILII